MQAMIERLMEENAKLRAEKMLLEATNIVESSTSSTLLINTKREDQINLYSTVKYKKFNNFKENFAFNNNKTVTKASNGNKKPTDNDLFYVPIQNS